MAMLSREAAQAAIREIREGVGGISPEDRAVAPPRVLKALENVRRKLGSATKTLATNLYSKDTRFVYGLIQNAEDNSYSRAEADEMELYLSFSLYPDRIVLDSNEDGFCEKHVKAICGTGESTKTVSQGYIGEKGIGFKSVFKVAKKVHIQSEPFSFSFEHTRDSSDDGLGMVTPLDEEYDDLPEDVHTRITLTLLDPSSYERRVQDLLNIPDTLLLFLTKLDALRIKIYPQDESATEIKYTHDVHEGDDLETVTKTTTVDGNSTEETRYFYVTRKQINNLPRDEARKTTNQATVVLAFPVDEQDEPIINQQHAFAFLPLRLAGFTFLIQSDFTTQASREDVFHSTRNEYLLSGVAQTFRDAVLKFCDHPNLQYQWMRYLPSDSISDEFWRNLRPKIISLLSNTCCLRPWSEKSLRLPSELHWVTNESRDRYGEPLFADLVEEAYLSQNYTLRDFNDLGPLGTREINYALLIARLRSDLGRADSRMKAVATEQNWHTQTAKLLLTVLQTDFSRRNLEALKSLELIPLQDQRWVSAKTLPIFLPGTEAVPVPTDLGLNIVQPAAVSNTARKALFFLLGVTAASPNDIISLINRRYGAISTCTMAENISHLRYLYWNLPPDTSALDSNIFLCDQNTKKVYRTTVLMKHIYFEEEEEEYGPQQLLQSVKLGDYDFPGPAVHFLNAMYHDAVPTGAVHHGRSWKLWLSELAGVQSYPQLQNPMLPKLSDEFMFIISHRPEKLVGLLKRYWPFYESKMIPAMERVLRDCWVSANADLSLQLKGTFLPLPRLKAIVERLNIVKFPFLILPEELTDGDMNEWEFLKRFGVRSSGGTDDLYFYVEALSKIAKENKDGCSSNVLGALFEVYVAIGRNCSSEDHTKYIHDYFESKDMIYIPSSAAQDAKWVNSGACVWKAPEWLEAKRRLDGVSNFAECEHLFRTILKIGDANWTHFLQDLKTLREQNRGNIERLVDIYRCLWREFGSGLNWEDIRNTFEKSELVFVPSQNTWRPLSSCVWADDQVQIPRKAPIKNPYAALEDFFCRVLDVPRPNLEMHVQALKELAESRPAPSASEVKQTIMLISSMEPTTDGVTELRRSNIFSVILTNGQKTFTNTTADFAIVDRLEYGSAFAGKIRILDYSVEEVRACQSLLLALDLKRRYLSELVEEKTTAQDSVMNTGLSQSFRLKAYAIFRCTVHFHSQRSRGGDRSLYSQLLGTSIHFSDGISKSISVVQYGETVTVENSRANFHLEEYGGELRLYVPRDESAREECFFRQLPRRLITYFGIYDPEAEALLNGILGCTSLKAVDGILKDAGIVEVDGIKRPSEPGHQTHRLGYEDTLLEDRRPGSRESRTSQSGRSTPVPTQSSRSTPVPTQPGRSTPVPTQSGRSTPVPTQSSLFIPVPTQSNSSTPVPTIRMTRAPLNEVDHSVDIPRRSPSPDGRSSARYAALLERVINSAGRMRIPAWGSQSVDNVPNAPPLGVILFDSVFATRSMERDRKVGAAGELLVFEILLRLNLRGFSEDNWKSTIRKEVRVHTKYRDLDPWLGRETADITYVDSEGDLTDLLIEKGYLQGETWEDERPTYYLEVKTTTRDCNEQFYMSGSQYQRMQRMQLQPQRAAPNVYVILRVFSLEGKIGLQVYVDPESSRLRGELDFNVDTWAVKPAGNAPD